MPSDGERPEKVDSAAHTGATGQGGNVSQGGGKKNRNNKHSSNSTKGPRFEGRHDGLKGYVFEIGKDRQAYQFIKTRDEIADYMGRNIKDAGDIRQSIIKEKLIDIPEVAEPTDTSNPIEMEKWKTKYKLRQERVQRLQEHNKTFYAIVWSQCSDAMRERVAATEKYSIFSESSDGIALLACIKSAAYDFQESTYHVLSAQKAMIAYFNFKQAPHMSVQDYYDEFVNRYEVYTHNGGHKTAMPGTLTKLGGQRSPNADADDFEDDETGTTTDMEEAVGMEQACLFIHNADRHRYESLKIHLHNEYLNGVNKYPKTLNDAYNVLTHWKDNNITPRSSTVNDGVAFATTGSSSSGDGESNSGRRGNRNRNGKKDGGDSEGGDKSKATESNNNKSDVAPYSLSSNCNHNFNLTTLGGWTFSMPGHTIPSTWILLDNQSTVDVFCYDKLLTNVRTCDETMEIHCNAGKITTSTVGDLPGYGSVWYCPNGIANILSMANVRKKGHHITYNNNANTFKVTKLDGTTMYFTQSDRGLYYHDTAVVQSSVAMVNTVADNSAKFSDRDVSRAKEARKLLQALGYPSQQQFLDILDNNQLINCPVTRRDATIAYQIFGPDVASLKGKTVHRASNPVQTEVADLPPNIMDAYRDVTLCGDIMFVNRIAFFVTISRHIHFGTVEMIGNRQPSTVLQSLQAIKKIYAQRGFHITHVLLDGEFASLQGPLSEMGVQLNVASNDEHVPEAERYIRTLKDRTRSIYHSLPFQTMPPRLITEMVYASNFWLNAFPHPSGISTALSPRAIITGSRIDYSKHCKLVFGSYVQTHEEHDNSLDERTTDALALRPTGNNQGGWFFYSLTSGRVINRNHWTEVPMPDSVITKVRNLARRARANRQGLLFQDRNGQNLDHDDDNDTDADDDSTYSPGDDADDSTVPDDDRHEGVANDNDYEDNAVQGMGQGHDDIVMEDENQGVPANEPPEAPEDENQGVGGQAMVDNIVNNVEVPIVAINENPGVGAENNNADGENPGVEVNDEENRADAGIDQNINEVMDERYGPRTGRYDLRPRRMPDYGHLHISEGIETHIVMTQHGVNKGLKLFGDAGIEAVKKELKQLHERKVIVPVNSKKMTREEKQQALQYLMFLKQKRCGTIKGRGCADGRKQRTYMTKEETSSPTVSTEALMLSTVIDADEERDVATADIPGAFLHADMDDVVYMRIDGKMAELLLEIDPDTYKEYAEVFAGKTVIYVRLEKALYGTLKAAILFWQKLSKLLKSWGFHINPYDECVANKDINGKQCTILWHVDDLKISHVDPAVVTEIIEKLSGEFGVEAPLTVRRGKVHEYLGMTIDYETKGKVRIIMKEYIEKILEGAPEDMNGVSPSPAANYLFNVNETNPVYLNDDEAEYYHHTVAQLLFLCKRARPDIQTAVSFLCTRVQKPDCDDYKKLGRVLKYLRGTIDMPLTLEASNTCIMRWWVDASYGVHPDMKSHTGSILSMGKGAIYASSTRQKINTKSSTEAELVGVNDALSQILWTKNFLKEQGYGCDEAVIHQDNMSAMLLERNGRGSSSKRTRHINIRYYFVKDKIAQKEVKVEYCATNDMVADFFTKPLQGMKFVTFRDYIMNVPSAKDYYALQEAPSTSVNDASVSSTDDTDDRSVLECDGLDTCGSSNATSDASVFEELDTTSMPRGSEEHDSWQIVAKKKKKTQRKSK